jgi:hypothetical protein
METITRTSLDALLVDLEDLWLALDRLLDSLHGPDWQRKHGKDWLYADVPFHLSYFDRDIVAVPLGRGLNIPLSEQTPRRSDAELNAWNEEKFRQRPTAQTVEQSLAQMRASRELVRRAAASLTDADLKRPAFIGLPGGGWTTAQVVLDSCYMHTWSHFVELRARLKRTRPELKPGQTRRAARVLASFMPIFLDRQAMQAIDHFSFVMNFSGPGAIAFTINIKDGASQISEGLDPQADLVMTQEPEMMVKMRAGMVKPPLAMLTGKIKVKGMGKMGTFGKLFHPPKPDQELPFNPTPPNPEV